MKKNDLKVLRHGICKNMCICHQKCPLPMSIERHWLFQSPNTPLYIIFMYLILIRSRCRLFRSTGEFPSFVVITRQAGISYLSEFFWALDRFQVAFPVRKRIAGRIKNGWGTIKGTPTRKIRKTRKYL